MRTTVYISGGLHGYNREQQNKFFKDHANELWRKGYDPILPQDIPPYHPNTSDPCPRAYSSHDFHSAACYLRGDLIAMLQCDVVLMIGDWQRSVGAALVEHHAACASGMTVYYKIEDMPFRRVDE